MINDKVAPKDQGYEHQNTAGAITDDACGDVPMILAEQTGTIAGPPKYQGPKSVNQQVKEQAGLAHSRAIADLYQDDPQD